MWFYFLLAPRCHLRLLLSTVVYREPLAAHHLRRLQMKRNLLAYPYTMVKKGSGNLLMWFHIILHFHAIWRIISRSELSVLVGISLQFCQYSMKQWRIFGRWHCQIGIWLSLLGHKFLAESLIEIQWLKSWNSHSQHFF